MTRIIVIFAINASGDRKGHFGMCEKVAKTLTDRGAKRWVKAHLKSLKLPLQSKMKARSGKVVVVMKQAPEGTELSCHSVEKSAKQMEMNAVF